jgi:hypothetical protein
MADGSRIDLLELDKMLRAGKRTGVIAKSFHVTPGAVSQAKKKLKTMVIRATSLEKVHDVVETHLDMMGQLTRVNIAINEELERAKRDIESAEDKDKRFIQETIVKLSAEIRKQLGLQLEIAQIWHDQKIVAEFQKELLDILNEVEPTLKNEVIRRLKQRNALRRSVQIA